MWFKKVSQLVLLFATFTAVSFYLTISKNDAQTAIDQEHLVLKYLSLFLSKPEGGDKSDSDNKCKASIALAPASVPSAASATVTSTSDCRCLYWIGLDRPQLILKPLACYNFKNYV